jgi:hypothetical protein
MADGTAQPWNTGNDVDPSACPGTVTDGSGSAVLDGAAQDPSTVMVFKEASTRRPRRAVSPCPAADIAFT